jgi:hypothetical protein
MYPSRPKLTLAGELPEKMENEDDHRDRIVTYKQKYQPELFMTHGKALECPQNPREADRRWGGTAPENLLPSHNARYATEPRANEPTSPRMQETHHYLTAEEAKASKPTSIAFEPMRQGAAKEQSSPRVKVKPSGVSLSQSPRLPMRELEFKSRQPTSPRMVLCKTLAVSLMCGCIMYFLKSRALALEATATTTATEPTATTTTATATAAAETTTATTATEAAAAAATTTTTEATTATTTTAATETTTTAAVGVTGLSIIQTDRPAIQVTAVQGLEHVLGIIDRGESHIGEALGATRLPD